MTKRKYDFRDRNTLKKPKNEYKTDDGSIIGPLPPIPNTIMHSEAEYYSGKPVVDQKMTEILRKTMS